MTDAPQHGSANSHRKSRGERGDVIEKDAVEARQGFRGKHVLYVLIGSLVLALIAFLILYPFLG